MNGTIHFSLGLGASNSFCPSSDIKGQCKFVLLFYHGSVFGYWRITGDKGLPNSWFHLVFIGHQLVFRFSGECTAVILSSVLLHTFINLLVTGLAKHSLSISF